MSDRASVLADAAVRVVAQRGLRGLTHRAVDAQAGLPAGATSNVFRTREKLLEALGDHLVTLDLAAWGGLPLRVPADVDELAGSLAALTATACTDADPILARFAVFTGAPAAFARHHRLLLDQLTAMLGQLRVADPEARARAVIDHLDGVMLHAVTVRRGEPVDAEALARDLRALLGRP